MRTFVTSVLSRRHWLVLLAVVFVQLFPAIASALFVLDTAKRGPSDGAMTGLIALLGAVALSLIMGGSVAAAVLMAGLAIASGVAMGSLLHRTQSLTHTFQGTMLGAMGIGTLLSLLGPDPATLVQPLVDELVTLMQDAGGASSEQVAILRDWPAAMLVGFLLAGLCLLFLAALILGYWWFTLASEGAAFGRAFRSLGLGRVVSLLSMGVLAVSVVTDWTIVEYLTPMAVVGFLFQGLAVMHAWSKAKGWHPLAVGLVYVTLVTPVSGFTIMGLSAAGLLDNFFALRAPLRGQS